MSTLSEISRAVQDIRKLLRDSITPDFFNSIKSTSDAIAQFLNDPNVSKDIKSNLALIHKLLQQADDEGLIKEAKNISSSIGKVIEQLDVNACNKILVNLGDLLEQMNNADFIEKMVDVLNSAKSIAEIGETIKTFLGEPTVVMMTYGPYAVILGMALSKSLNAILKKNNDSEFSIYMSENNERLAEISLTNIQILRENMKQSYLKKRVNLHNGVYDFDPQLRQYVINEMNYEFYFINTIPKIRKEAIMAMAAINTSLEKLIEKFAKEEIENQSLEQYLNYIGKGYSLYLDELLNYIVYSHQLIKYNSLVKPAISHNELNFDSICRIYGTQTVVDIMKALSNNFMQNGGAKLYYELANSFENNPLIFLSILKDVSHHKPPEIENNEQPPSSKEELQNYFHREAEKFIKNEWEKITWPCGYEKLDYRLSNEMIQIIKVRAFAKYCQDTASYFFGLYPIPRDIYNGVLDIPKGIFQAITHPIETIKGVAGSLFTPSGLGNLIHSAWHHPTRALTPLLVTGATGYVSRHLPTSSQVSCMNASNTTAQFSAYNSSGVFATKASIIAKAAEFTSKASTIAKAAAFTKLTDKDSQNFTIPTFNSEGHDPQHNNETRLHQRNNISIDWDALWNYLISNEERLNSGVDVYQLIQEWHPATKASKSISFHPHGFFQGCTQSHNLMTTEQQNQKQENASCTVLN